VIPGHWQRRCAILAVIGAAAVGPSGCGRDTVLAGPGTVFPAMSKFESLEQPLARPLTGAMVVNFWASWCGPCRAEMSALQRLDDQLRIHGIRVVAVSIDSDRNLAREFARGTQIRLPAFFDLGGRFATPSLGLRTLPETFIVDAGGIIRARVRGARDWSSPESIRYILEHVRGNPSGTPGYRGAAFPY